MTKNSKIEWTHHTVNFWWGCAKVSPACAHCYAEGQAARFHPGLWGPDGERRLRVDAAGREAFRYERQAIREGRRLRVFTNSMSDFFEDRRDLDMARLDALDVIRQTPHLDWLILTKRPERVVAMMERALGQEIPGKPVRTWLEGWLDGTSIAPRSWGVKGCFPPMPHKHTLETTSYLPLWMSVYVRPGSFRFQLAPWEGG